MQQAATGRPRPGAITGSQLLALVRLRHAPHTQVLELLPWPRPGVCPKARRKPRRRPRWTGRACGAVARGWRGCAGRPSSARTACRHAVFEELRASYSVILLAHGQGSRRRSAPACGRASPVARRALLWAPRPNIPAPRAREGSVSRLARGIPRLPAARCSPALPGPPRGSLPGREAGLVPVEPGSFARPRSWSSARDSCSSASALASCLGAGRRGSETRRGRAWSSRSSASVRVALGHLAVVALQPASSAFAFMRGPSSASTMSTTRTTMTTTMIGGLHSSSSPGYAVLSYPVWRPLRPRARRLPRRAASPGARRRTASLAARRRAASPAGARRGAAPGGPGDPDDVPDKPKPLHPEITQPRGRPPTASRAAPTSGTRGGCCATPPRASAGRARRRCATRLGRERRAPEEVAHRVDAKVTWCSRKPAPERPQQGRGSAPRQSRLRSERKSLRARGSSPA